MEKKQVVADFPYDESNIVKDILMLWSFPLFRFFRNESADFHNTIKIPDRILYEQTYEALRREWKIEMKKSKPFLLKAIWKVLKYDFLKALLPGMICYNLLVISALMIIYIIDYISSDNEPTWHIVLYIFIYGIILQISSFGQNYSSIKMTLIIGKLKASITRLIYEKALKVDYGKISQGDQSGKFSSLISSDIEFLDGLNIMTFFCSTPIFLSISAILLWFNIGGAGLIGLGVALLHLPIIIVFGKLSGKYRYAAAMIGDSRMKMITNLIEGIRIVKLYGWEHPYLEALFHKRGLEVKQMTKKAFITTCNRCINFGLTGLVLFVSFSTYVGLGNTIKPSSAFSSVAVLNLCCNLISLIGTMGILVMFLVLTSMKRITQALVIKNRDKATYEVLDSGSIKLSHCSFSWKEPELPKNSESELETIRENKANWVLNDINFKAKQGELILVIGPVGAGKTALFMGILKEIFTVHGHISLHGKISIAAEEPWIVSGTIKENILMGKEFDQSFYDKVIRACCLEKDLQLFKEFRDETVVGDRGITLSGGQKARVSLARAIYYNRDIILLDDPLSAVDPEVCSKIFTSCIKDLLSEKTVILATHQVHFASQADKILILENGSQLFFGTYQQLIDKGLIGYLGKISQAQETDQETDTKNEEIPQETKIAMKDHKSITVEEKAEGSVPLTIYWQYLMLGYKHWACLVLTLALQVLGQVSYLAVIFWVAYWSRQSNQHDSSYFVGMGVLVVLLYLLTILRQYIILYPLIQSAKNLHNLALAGITFTHSVFFDKNPTGRMLNRFAKDTSQMDETLLSFLGETMNSFSLVTGTFVVVVIICPYILIVLAFTIFYLVMMVKYFARPNKDLRRVELLTRSPILSHLNTSINGLCTLRCLNLKKKFVHEMEKAVELNLKTFIAFQLSMRTLQMYLEIGPNFTNIINVIVLVVIRNSLQPGLAGLSIALSVSIFGYVGYLFKTLIETDNYMASPQRLFEYKSLSNEGDLNTNSGFKVSEGKIEVVGLYMKYRENYDFALKNLNFVIKPRSKTGIIGRTGAGKSSIMQVLFRLVTPEQGFIYIDGQDYMKAGLHDIRKQMSVIPQSAVLFMASLKDNLDPFHEHSDEEITKVLHKVRLGNLLESLPDGLNTLINAKGLSLSAGQKQLVCLARAIIRKNKVVMIDEATANVDHDTDEFIQGQLMKRFKKSTLLIIAHRLRTVIESDWIIVMDEGTTKEEGYPRDLIKNPDSALLTMIGHTGPEESQYLLSRLKSEYEHKINITST